MKRVIFGFVCILFVAKLAPAQTISPVIVEYTDKADGRFEVYNDGDLPLTVVVEPHSFTVDSTGKATFRPLDPSLHVELSTTSFRVAPKQTYYVFYKATTETYPNWFCIYATVTGATTSTGLKLALQLPHTVYLLGRKSLDESKITWNKAELTVSGDKRQITAEVENHSSEYGRVQEVDILSGSRKQTFPGFPLFPGQKRDLQLDWDQPGTPEQIVLKFPKFKMESGLKEPIVAQQ